MPTMVNPSGNQSIDALLWGWKWDSPNMTVRFPTSAGEYQGYAGIQNFEAFTQTQANQILNFGLNNLSVFSGLNFSLSNTPGTGHLRFGQAEFVNYGNTGILQGPHVPGGGSAEGMPPSPHEIPNYAMGDTWYNLNRYTTPELGNFQYAAGLLHEVGHAIGLKHGHASQERADGTQNPITLPALPASENSQEFSIMTYSQYIGHQPDGGASGLEEYPWTYMMNDVAALQYMYGANYGPGANNGNSVYSFNASTGAMTINGHEFGASYHSKIFLNMWDGGGNDTYDFSNYSNNQLIDLRPGEWSEFSTAQLSNLTLGQNGVPAHFARGNLSNSRLFNNDARSLIENASAGSGNDRLTGNQTANALKGNAGNDTLDGREGGDALDGGAGADTVTYAFSAAGVFVNIHTGIGVLGDAQGDTLTSIESLIGSEHVDTLVGSPETNALRGGGGNDLIRPYAGNDFVDGGAGFDTVDYTYTGIALDISLINNGVVRTDGYTGPGGYNQRVFGIESVRGSLGDDTIWGNANSATTLDGHGGADILIGFNGADKLYGGAGNDIMNGGAGFDRLFGESGNDTFWGSAGIDIMAGSDGDDLVTYHRSSGGVLVNLAAGQGAAADAAGDLMSRVESVTGSNHADVLYGTQTNNALRGGGGNDIIRPYAGNDFIDGGAGTDILDYTPSATALNINLAASIVIGDDLSQRAYNMEQVRGGAGADVMRGNVATGTTLYGNGGSDALIGYNDADRLIGGAGNDKINGGADNDLLWGQSGADIFFGTNAMGRDQIMDWQNGSDRMYLGNVSGINSFSDVSVTLGSLGAFVYWDGGVDGFWLTGQSTSIVDASDFIF